MSRPQQLLDYLRAHPEIESLSSREVAAAIGMEQVLVSGTMRLLVRHEQLFTFRDGQEVRYTLKRPAVKQAPPHEPVPFNAALWVDGGLVIYGATFNKDGSVRVNAADVEAVRHLLAGRPAPHQPQGAAP